MSITAVGPAVRLKGPPPQAPLHGLLTIPGVLVADGGERWMNGVNLWGYPSGVPETWEPCATGTFREKSDASEQTVERFDPFAVYLPVSCSSLGMPAGFEDDARVALNASISFGIEEALANGVSGSTNPFLGDGNLDILAGGTAQNPGVALSYIENAIGATGRRGIIHATPAVVAALQAIPTGEDDEAEPLLTASGNYVVSGGGYIGTDPVSGATPGTTEDWMFATWMVEVRMSEMQLNPEDIVDALDTATNDVVYRAERYVLATFDSEFQAGVLVDWAS